MKVPAPLLWLKKGWMAFAHVLGRIMSTIILTILWIVGFGVYAIVLKIISIRKLWQKKPESYWIDVSEKERNLKYQF